MSSVIKSDFAEACEAYAKLEEHFSKLSMALEAEQWKCTAWLMHEDNKTIHEILETYEAYGWMGFSAIGSRDQSTAFFATTVTISGLADAYDRTERWKQIVEGIIDKLDRSTATAVL